MGRWPTRSVLMGVLRRMLKITDAASASSAWEGRTGEHMLFFFFFYLG